MMSYYGLRGRLGGSFNYGDAGLGQEWEVFPTCFCLQFVV